MRLFHFPCKTIDIGHGFLLPWPPVCGDLEGYEKARRNPPTSDLVDARKLYARSRVSNGKDLLPDIDGRSMVARRYRDIASAIVSDQGGFDHCSESRKQLIRRFAAASVLAEQMEANSRVASRSISASMHFCVRHLCGSPSGSALIAFHAT